MDKNMKDKMEKALKDYKKDKNSQKEFYQVMQELNEWLKDKGK